MTDEQQFEYAVDILADEGDLLNSVEFKDWKGAKAFLENVKRQKEEGELPEVLFLIINKLTGDDPSDFSHWLELERVDVSAL